jgi:hypothetical protein
MALAVLTIDLAMYLVWRPLFPPIIAGWKVAYVVFMCREGIADADLVTAIHGPVAYDLASRFVTAANATLLLGHMIASTIGAPRPSWERFPVDRVNGRALALILAVLGAIFLVIQLPAACRHVHGGTFRSSGWRMPRV